MEAVRAEKWVDLPVLKNWLTVVTQVWRDQLSVYATSSGAMYFVEGHCIFVFLMCWEICVCLQTEG